MTLGLWNDWKYDYNSYLIVEHFPRHFMDCSLWKTDNSLKSVKTLFQFDGSFFVCLLHVNIFEIFKKFCCEWLWIIIAVCHLGKLKLEKRLFLYECHLKPKRAFQVVYTPGFKNRSDLPKFARQRKTLHLWFKKRSRSSFFKFLELVHPSNRALSLWVRNKG